MYAASVGLRNIPAGVMLNLSGVTSELNMTAWLFKHPKATHNEQRYGGDGDEQPR